MAKVSSYPTWDCRVNGHMYGTLSIELFAHLTPKPDDARECKTCGKTQIHVLGVWCEPPKEPLRKKQQEIDPAQMSLF